MAIVPDWGQSTRADALEATDREAATNMDRCTNCNAELLPDDVSCAICGSKLEDIGLTGMQLGQAIHRPEPSPSDRHSTGVDPDVQSTADPVSDVPPSEAENEAGGSEPLGNETPPFPEADPAHEAPLPEDHDGLFLEDPPPNAQAEKDPAIKSAQHELQDRLDLAIVEYTKGNISAATLSQIEAQVRLQSEQLGLTADNELHDPPETGEQLQARADAVEGNPASRDAEDRPDSEAARYPSAIVEIPTDVDPGMIRSRVQRALVDAGEDKASLDYLQQTDGIKDDFDALLTETAKWVTIVQLPSPGPTANGRLASVAAQRAAKTASMPPETRAQQIEQLKRISETPASRATAQTKGGALSRELSGSQVLAILGGVAVAAAVVIGIVLANRGSGSGDMTPAETRAMAQEVWQSLSFAEQDQLCYDMAVLAPDAAISLIVDGNQRFGDAQLSREEATIAYRYWSDNCY